MGTLIGNAQRNPQENTVGNERGYGKGSERNASGTAQLRERNNNYVFLVYIPKK